MRFIERLFGIRPVRKRDRVSRLAHLETPPCGQPAAHSWRRDGVWPGSAGSACWCALLSIALGQPALAQEAGLKPGRIVTHYALTADNDYHSNDPKDWQLLGSNDEGKTWTCLDKQTNQIFVARSQRQVFTIRNQVAYNVYRLQVDRAFSSEDAVEIAEIELMGPVVGVTNETALHMAITASLAHPLMGPAAQAFDGDIATKWWDFGLGSAKTSWIQCQYVLQSDRTLTYISQLILSARQAAMDNPLQGKAETILSNLTAQAANTSRALTGYALTSANDTPTRDPRDWRLQGSKEWRQDLGHFGCPPQRSF